MIIKRALLLINCNSRNGATCAEEAVRMLESHGIHVIVERTDSSQCMADAIGRCAGEVNCVIVAGGDGTLNAAAGPLLEHGLPLGILPTGTANDLARTLAIPPSLEAAVAVIAQGVTQRIDLGCVNGVYFFNVANIGLGVKVRHAMSPEAKKRWGALSYPLSLISAFRSNQPFRAAIKCDDKHLVLRAIQIGVGNGRHYGGGMVVAEDASINDNMLSFYALKPAPIWSLLAIVPAFKSGKFDSIKPAITLRGRHIRIETRHPMQVSTDGEVRAMTPAEFSIAAGALTVLVPAGLSTEGDFNHADKERNADRAESGERAAAADRRSAR
jgi:diacylglycerol kinase (ATP)